MKLVLVSVAVVILSLGCGKKANEPTWQQLVQSDSLSTGDFTDHVATAVREAMPAATVTLDGPLRLKVTTDVGESLCNLENAWRDCSTDPVMRVDVVRRHVDALKSVFAANTENAIRVENIVPVIKDKSWLDETSKQGMQVYHERLVADLFVTYAVDGPSQLRFIDQTEFVSLNMNPEKVRITALSNLANRLPKIERLGEGPLYMLTAGGTFESSLLLLANIWEEQEKAVDGRIVVAVPSRELLLFTGENAHEAVQQMQSTVADIHIDGNYLISETILVRDNGRWLQLRGAADSNDSW